MRYDSHRESARNLVHYIALRQHDVRDLQEKLTENGLSSLGRCEANVLGAIDAVLRVLHRITGKAEASAAESEQEQTAIRGWELLGRNTDALLGPRCKSEADGFLRGYSWNGISGIEFGRLDEQL